MIVKYREAFEEVSLPLHSSSIHTLCLLQPFLSQYRLVVTPVVALLTDLSILDNLVPAEGEVARIFDYPLEALLDPNLASKEPLVEKGSEDWPYDAELHVIYRGFSIRYSSLTYPLPEYN